MGGLCPSRHELRSSSAEQLINTTAPFHDWKEIIQDEWTTKSLQSLAVHSDFPRLAPVMTIGGTKVSCAFGDDDMWAARSEKVRQALLQVAELTGDHTVAAAVARRWDDLVPVTAVDMAPAMLQVLRECVPEDSPTARTLRCFGQGMLFAPLSHIKHLAWQPWGSALRDCPRWDIAVDRDAYVRVIHVRRQEGAFGDRHTPRFDFLWRLEFLLNQKDCALSDVTLDVLSLRIVQSFTRRFDRRYQERRAALVHAFLTHWPRVQILTVRRLDPS